jgi:two-component system sensor histidine kinase UhpB
VDGKPVASHGIMVDVTQRKQAEEALRASHEQIQDLAGRLIAAQETERSRIARELHDDISQRLAALAIAHSGLKRRLLPASSNLQEEVTRLQQHTISLAEAVRDLSRQLHPGVLQHAGLVAAIRGHCDEFSRLHDLKVTFRAEADLKGVPDDVALCLYRVAQEALHNVAAHAGARHAEVALTRVDRTLELTITDDGRGFDRARVSYDRGLGLISIDERVRLVHGRVEIDSRPDRGTTVQVQVPLGEPPISPEDRQPSTRRSGTHFR